MGFISIIVSLVLFIISITILIMFAKATKARIMWVIIPTLFAAMAAPFLAAYGFISIGLDKEQTGIVQGKGTLTYTTDHSYEETYFIEVRTSNGTFNIVASDSQYWKATEGDEFTFSRRDVELLNY